MQMPHVSFTQFRNELARVLGTHQCSSVKSTGKSISTSSVGVKSDEVGAVFKSQWKWHKNSVLNPLRSRIFVQNWIAQLSKIHKFGSCSIQLLSKQHLPMHYRLHSLVRVTKAVITLSKVNHFWASPWSPSFLLGSTGALTWTNPVTIAKIRVMIWEIASICKYRRHS